MEAFGRVIAMAVSIIGVGFLLLFSKTAAARWQCHEAVRSMSYAFAEQLLENKKMVLHEWEAFQKKISQMGGYRAELAVYEGRRFEDEDGGFYLYQRADISEDLGLKGGSYVRLVVTGEDFKSGNQFCTGDYGVIIAGGRVQ